MQRRTTKRKGKYKKIVDPKRAIVFKDRDVGSNAHQTKKTKKRNCWWGKSRNQGNRTPRKPKELSWARKATRAKGSNFKKQGIHSGGGGGKTAEYDLMRRNILERFQEKGCRSVEGVGNWKYGNIWTESFGGSRQRESLRNGGRLGV